ncbi:MAG: hypothetical protein KDB96_09590, partial [Flavobacteriales bacterium]|nr:hypothetical protein [Flavobacteriales bacterium]
MKKVKAGLRGLSAAQKVDRGNAVLEQMTGNPYFPDPVPSLQELQVATDDLEQACVDALDRGRMACARKRSAVARFDKLLSALTSYVNGVSMGNEEMLYSSGLPIAKRPAPLTDLKVPNGLSFKRTQFPDQWEVRWNRVPGAVVYELEFTYRPEDVEAWQRAELTTKPSARV